MTLLKLILKHDNNLSTFKYNVKLKLLK
jgi:hypothetical protein